MIAQLLNDHRHFHCDYQIDSIITYRNGGTLYGCYKQAVRELHKRWRGLRDLYRQRDLLEIDLAELSESAVVSLYDQRRREIELREKRLSGVELAGVIRDTEAEFLRFLGQALACRRALGLRDDQSMPDELRQRLDAEMWHDHIRRMAALDYVTAQALSRGTVEILACAPIEQRHKLLAEICDQSQHEALMDWYMTAASPMPDPILFSPEEQQKALQCVFSPSFGPLSIGTAAALLSSPVASTDDA